MSDPSTARLTTLAVKVSRADLADLSVAASLEGLSLAAWVRRTLCRAAGLPEPVVGKAGWRKGRPRQIQPDGHAAAPGGPARVSGRPDGPDDGPDRPDAA